MQPAINKSHLVHSWETIVLYWYSCQCRIPDTSSVCHSTVLCDMHGIFPWSIYFSRHLFMPHPQVYSFCTHAHAWSSYIHEYWKPIRINYTATSHSTAHFHAWNQTFEHALFKIYFCVKQPEPHMRVWFCDSWYDKLVGSLLTVLSGEQNYG